jgi:hypothetical protein
VEELLREMLCELREQNRIGRAILEQVEDARVDSAKHNCKEAMGEQIQAMMRMMAGTPMGPTMAPMFETLMRGVKKGT